MNTLMNDIPMIGQQNLSLMLLANDLLYKALEMHCSDLQLEPDGDLLYIRYLSRGETKKDMQLPHDVHSELAFCYKVLAGLNIKDHSRPQDRHTAIGFNGKSVDMRVTAIPGEFGETIAISFKYPD
jgi:type II secretory ATPase GspE/PulE/Tfp pilus assembly ATPase PilB-like protein